MALFGRAKTLSDVPLPSFQDVKRRTRVLVIDDDANSFPFDLMRREGYSVEHWPRVESMNPLEEGQYDIVILDIQDVAGHISESDGLGVLELIKARNPAQIVVAFSGHSFDLGKNKFWRMADDALCKPVDVAACKRIIDGLIEAKRTPQHYWSAVASVLEQHGVSPKDIAKLEDRVARALQRKDAGDVRSVLSKAVDSAEVGVKLAALGLKISALFGL